VKIVYINTPRLSARISSCPVLFDVSKEIILVSGASQGLGWQFARVLSAAWRCGGGAPSCCSPSCASRYLIGSAVKVEGGFADIAE
jgi:3-oxoacyl-[acyl-carrier protein] reductase